ncbi:Methyltransferase domain-containing protein [Alkalispirochaeta americana]|uniref:Methyltransferase domain-containing protein n=1 Tax=Alkalispirochaeta americana TaxID=159291 RepID=A0A1N6YBT2_9SPIO|nr:class I SAM-dependent methyltransferase [Alkalispirochaeta americana]SIR11966.1 Methyltransferase domain-containing protein [Alkalispirochaeta americana]
MNRSVWNERYQAGHGSLTAPPVEPLRAFAERLTPGYALDLACGAGRNALYLASQGWNVTGVDFSDVALTVARERSPDISDRVTWEEADLRAYAPREGFYDLVVITYLHVPREELRCVFSTAERALKTGGLLYFLGHHRNNISRGTGSPRHADVAHVPAEILPMIPWCTIISAREEARPPDHDRGGSGREQQIDSLVIGQKRS